MLRDLFSKKKYATVMLYKDADNKVRTVTIDNFQKVSEDKLKAPIEDSHPRIAARDRVNSIIDKGTFAEYDTDLKTIDALNFPGYMEKVKIAMENSNEEEAVITGEGKITGRDCIICVMEPNFMMGSMGSVVGEKITRAIERAIEKGFPLIIFTASGGARMQEGILSLMQMAKTSAALGRLSEEGLLYIAVLTNPTTGGVTASFAMLGDIIISEPGALIGFAGPRVIEQTIKQKLPEGFQRAEFLQEKGFVDKIVHRKNMKAVLSEILKIHASGGGNNA
ncbi:MAG TPA: acetyl-CoA carboxylase, carboxyltransferase subunit beta [Clostridia bacterium]|nr:acetyl-CoA carboxylase, carboxyltransferase subunit beta [Clostridia bacterium]